MIDAGIEVAVEQAEGGHPDVIGHAAAGSFEQLGQVAQRGNEGIGLGGAQPAVKLQRIRGEVLKLAARVERPFLLLP